MTDEPSRSLYTRQSRFTDPGHFCAALDTVPPGVAGLRDTAAGLVFHYRGDGDYAENGIAPERISEIDTRYADLMIDRLLALRRGLTVSRSPAERLVGCCRDFALLFVTMARHHGVPARIRIGFAGYFVPSWYVDHAVAEVWDAAESRWRLVEPEVGAGHVDPTDGRALDVLDVDRTRFLTGAAAWRACRSGAADPERFVVAPDVDEVPLRSWPYLSHNLRFDLAALNRQELILWDDFGRLAGPDPVSAADLDLLDALAAVTAQPDPDPGELAAWLDRDEFRVPPVVSSFSPAAGARLEVALRA